jgi:hypothetical protein
MKPVMAVAANVERVLRQTTTHDAKSTSAALDTKIMKPAETAESQNQNAS